MKQINYTHINKLERLEISILLGKGYSIRNIAKTMHRGKSSICDEIKLNSVNGVYDPHKANHKACVKRKYSKYQGMKVVKNNKLRKYVEEKLKLDWSPDTISGRIKEVDKHIKYISSKGIYKYIASVYGRNLEEYLLRKYKKSSNKNYTKASNLEDRIFIDKRPEYINNRAEFGDFEGDFIVSGKDGSGALLVVEDRKGKHIKIRRVLSRTNDFVNNVFYEMTGGYIDINSLTLDNDISFRKHVELSNILNTEIYFCNPYHSWEKGSIENTNGLIRRYIKKGTDISKLSDEYIQWIEDRLNNRPRKCLNFRSPNEVMIENNQFKNIDKIQLNNYDILEINKKTACPA